MSSVMMMDRAMMGPMGTMGSPMSGDANAGGRHPRLRFANVHGSPLRNEDGEVRRRRQNHLQMRRCGRGRYLAEHVQDDGRQHV